jgi:hypothetical protein
MSDMVCADSTFTEAERGCYNNVIVRSGDPGRPLGVFYGLASDILSTHAVRRRGDYAVVPIQGLVDNVAPGTE